MPAKNQKDAGRAHRLTAKIEKKGRDAIPPADLVWLANYKRAHGKKMPGGPNPPGPFPVVHAARPVPVSDASAVEGSSTPPPAPTSGEDSTPAFPGAPMAVDTTGESGGSSPHGGATPMSEPPPVRDSSPSAHATATYSAKPEHSAESLALAGELAAGYCAFVKGASKILRDADYLAISDELVDTIVHRAALRLAIKAIPTDADTEELDIAIVAGTSAFTAVQVVRLKSKQSKEAKVKADQANWVRQADPREVNIKPKEPAAPEPELADAPVVPMTGKRKTI